MPHPSMRPAPCARCPSGARSRSPVNARKKRPLPAIPGRTRSAARLSWVRQQPGGESGRARWLAGARGYLFRIDQSSTEDPSLCGNLGEGDVLCARRKSAPGLVMRDLFPRAVAQCGSVHSHPAAPLRVVRHPHQRMSALASRRRSGLLRLLLEVRQHLGRYSALRLADPHQLAVQG